MSLPSLWARVPVQCPSRSLKPSLEKAPASSRATCAGGDFLVGVGQGGRAERERGYDREAKGKAAHDQSFV